MSIAGLRLYYHSPSFLLSAGGQFLNSGYGYDEIDYRQRGLGADIAGTGDDADPDTG